MNEKISVIVPIYNVEMYLRKCIDSILAQTYKNFELLLIDDGSPDHCPHICDDYAKKDSRVQVIHKKRGGLVSARNTGLLNADGDYICYVDGDDWIKSNLLETVINKGINPYHPDMVVYGAIRQYETHQEIITSGGTEGLYDKARLNKEIYPYLMYDYRKPFCKSLIFPVAWNKIYRRSFLLEHYCLDERIRMGEDNAFVFECLFSAHSVYFCEDTLYIYNQLNSCSMIHSYDPTRFENNKILTDYMQMRMGGINQLIDNQLNAFKAYWLIMAIFHEIKSGRAFFQARKHIKRKIKETKVLDEIKREGLPKSAVAYLLLLRLKLYGLALIGANIVTMKQKNRELEEKINENN